MEENQNNKSIQQENQNKPVDIQLQKQKIKRELNNTSYETLIKQSTQKSFGLNIGKLIIFIASVCIIFILYMQMTPFIKRAKYEKKIDNSISIIEQTFHPNEIEITPQTSPDIKLIKEYQDSVLKAVGLWREVAAIKPASAYKKFDGITLQNKILEELDLRIAWGESTTSVLQTILKLAHCGDSLSIYIYVPDIQRVQQLMNMQIRRNEISKREILKVKETINLFNQHDMYHETNSTYYLYKGFRKAVENDVVYEFDNEILTFFIEMNDKYMSYYNSHYKNNNNNIPH